jgi:hypothetical protein
MRPRDHPAELE